MVSGLLLAGGARAQAPFTAGSISPYTDPATGALGALGTTATGAVVGLARGAQGTWTASDVAGPGAVAGPAVPYIDPANHELLAFAQAPSGDFIQFERIAATGAWTAYDMTTLFNLPTVAGPVAPYTDPGNGELLAFAQTPSGDFVQFERLAATGAWAAHDITAAFSLSKVAGPVVPYTDPANGELLAFARSPSGDFVQFERNSTTGAWRAFDISSLFNASTVAGPVIPYTDPGNGELIAFAQSPRGDFVQFERQASTGNWIGYDMTSLFNLSKVAGPVVPYTDPGNRELIAFSRAPNGDLVQFERPGPWTESDLTDLSGVGYVAGAVVPYADPSTHDLLAFATDPSGGALAFSRDAGGSWTAEPVPTPAPVQPVAVNQVLPVPPVSKHRGGRAVRARFVLAWTWDHTRTRLRSVRVRGLPRGARIDVRCKGDGCPRTATASAYKRLARFRRALDGRVFRAGDVMTITVSAANRRSERIAVRFRDGKAPSARLL
jgi:hypothetical protein